MKTIFYFLFLLLPAYGLLAQSNNLIRGIITIQNSNAQPADNVQVTTFGANPVYTNSAGQFELKVSGGKPGQTVRLIVQKASFHILGPDPMVYETALRDNPNDLIRIVMANVQAFQERVDRFMGSIDKKIQEQNLTLKSLREEQAAESQEAERKKLMEKIAQLYQQVADLEKSKEELARQFATIDLDQASEFTRKALEKFEQGELEEALALMDKDKLDEYYANVVQQQEKMEKARQQAVENYMVLARMQRANLQNEAAIETYREALAKDSANVANLIELGSFLSEINLENEGFQYFVSALDYSRDDLQYLDILTTVGGILVVQNLFQLADSILVEAYDLGKRLGPSATSQQIKVMGSLSTLKQSRGELDQSEAYLQEGIELCKPLYESNRELYFTPWVSLQINLSLLYLLAGDIEKASDISLEVFKAYEEMPGEKNVEQRLALGYLLNNMGHGLASGEEYEIADTLFLLAESICLELEAEKKPAAAPLKSLVYNNLGMGLYNRGEFEKAVPILKDALDINLELGRRNYLRFQPMVGLISGNLAMAEYNLENYEASSAYFEQSIEAYRYLSEMNPEQFLPHLALAEENQLMLIADTQPLDSLIRAQFHYIATLRKLETLFPGQIGEKIAYYCGETAWNQILTGNYQGAVKTARDGLKEDPAQNWIYSVLAPALLLSGDYKAANEIYTARKNEPYSLDENKTLQEVFLEDIDTLEGEKRWSEDFKKIRKMLGK
ncbi:MAG: tetratricopeptide repeat protein [Saprospirales bacterium]|nr:tetratricopeptide repeat protein [Saprospirales bacterium]